MLHRVSWTRCSGLGVLRSCVQSSDVQLFTLRASTLGLGAEPLHDEESRSVNLCILASVPFTIETLCRQVPVRKPETNRNLNSTAKALLTLSSVWFAGVRDTAAFESPGTQTFSSLLPDVSCVAAKREPTRGFCCASAARNVDDSAQQRHFENLSRLASAPQRQT